MKTCRRSEGMDLHNLNLNHYTGNWPTSIWYEAGWAQAISGGCGGENNFLLMSGIELRFLEHLACLILPFYLAYNSILSMEATRSSKPLLNFNGIRVLLAQKAVELITNLFRVQVMQFFKWIHENWVWGKQAEYYKIICFVWPNKITRKAFTTHVWKHVH